MLMNIMTYMKKNLIRILLLGSVLILCSCQKSQELKWITFCDSYNSFDGKIEVGLYLNQKNSPYTNVNNIIQAKIVDQSTGDAYQVKISEIIDEQESIKHRNITYYSYDFKISMLFSSSEIIKMPKAHLVIDYLNDKQITLHIGNLSYVTSDNDFSLSIGNMMGIVNDINYHKTLCGIVLRIKNLTDFDVHLKEILMVNAIGEITYQNITILSKLPNSNNLEMNSLLNKTYNYLEKNNLDSIDLIIKEEIILLLPISYLDEQIINQTGLVLKYYLNGEEKSKIINNFKFFNSFYLDMFSEA